MQHQVVWVDIPVRDLQRATRFYSAVLGAKLTTDTFEKFSMTLLPHSETSVGGCLYASKDNAPSETGPLVYMNVDGRLEKAVEAALGNGGKILMDRHQIGPHGWRAIVLDSEGNRIALHSTS